MQFQTKNATLTETKIICNNNVITEVSHTKFVGDKPIGYRICNDTNIIRTK